MGLSPFAYDIGLNCSVRLHVLEYRRFMHSSQETLLTFTRDLDIASPLARLRQWARSKAEAYESLR